MAGYPRVTQVIPCYDSGPAVASPQFQYQYVGQPTKGLSNITMRQMRVSIQMLPGNRATSVFTYLNSGKERDVYQGHAGGRDLVMKLVSRLYDSNQIEFDMGGRNPCNLFCRVFSNAAVKIDGMQCDVLLAEHLVPCDVYLHRSLVSPCEQAVNGLSPVFHEFLRLMHRARTKGYILGATRIEKLGWAGASFVMLCTTHCERDVVFDGASWNKATQDFLESVWDMVKASGLEVIVRLLMLSGRRDVQQSPLRFCGGREILRLSQTTSAMRDVAATIHPCSFHYIVGVLAGERSLE